MEESEKWPGRYYLYMNGCNIDHVTPDQMYALIILFECTLRKLNFKPSGIPFADVANSNEKE